MAENTLKNTNHGAANVERLHSVCFTPRVDILENDEAVTIYADMPGVRPEDVEVQFEDGELSLHGRCQATQEGRNFLAAEYGVGDFYRAFTLNHDIDVSKVSAELRQGVLTVRLPKSEAVRPRRIQVQGG